jgi:hypothetical protein
MSDNRDETMINPDDPLFVTIEQIDSEPPDCRYGSRALANGVNTTKRNPNTYNQSILFYIDVFTNHQSGCPRHNPAR